MEQRGRIRNRFSNEGMSSLFPQGRPWSCSDKACAECYELFLSFADKSWPEALEVINQKRDKEEAKRTSRARERLRALRLTPIDMPKAEVTCEEIAGWYIKSSYAVFNAKEFLLAFDCEAHHLKLGPSCRIRNEENRWENLWVFHTGAPRKLVTFRQVRDKLAQHVMRHHIREGQARDTYNVSLKRNFSKRVPAIRLARRSRIKAMAAVRKMAKQRMKKLADAENSGPLASGSEELQEKEEEPQGLVLPDDDEEEDVKGGRGRKGKKGAKRKAQPAAAGLQEQPSLKRGGAAKLSSALSDAGIGVSRAGSGSTPPRAPQDGSDAYSVATMANNPGGKFYFDYDALLAGKQDMTKVQGARRHLGTLAGNVKAYQALEEEIDLATACCKLAPKCRASDSVPNIQGNLAKVKGGSFKVTVPVEVYIDLTQKYVEALIQHEEFAEVATAIRIWLDAGEEEAGFNEQSPAFSALVPLCESEEDLRLVAEAIESSFFSNSFLELFSEPVDDQDLPKSLCMAVLQEESRIDNVDEAVIAALPDLLCERVECVHKVARAIIAVSDPVPGLLGSTYAEAADVFGEGETEANVRAVRLAALKAPVWRSRIATYWTLGAEDAAIASAHQKLLKELVAEPLEVTLVNKAVAAATKWGKQVRNGGMRLVYQALSAWALKQEATVDRADQARARAAIVNVIRLIDPKGDSDRLQALAKQCTDLITKERGEQALLQLEVALQDPEAKTTKLPEVQSSLDQCVGMAMAPKQAQSLHEFAGLLHGSLVDLAGDTDTASLSKQVKSRIADVQKVCQSIYAIPAVQALQVVDMTSQLLPRVQSAISYKGLVAKVKGESLEYDEDTLTSLLAAHRELHNKAEVPAGAENLRLLEEFITALLVESQADFEKYVSASRLSAIADLNKAVKNLAKVGGGTSNGTSWKQGLDPTASLDAQNTKAALETLSQLHASAITKRIPVCSEACAILHLWVGGARADCYGPAHGLDWGSHGFPLYLTIALDYQPTR